MNYLEKLSEVANKHVQALEHAEKNYGDSWKNRGGVGAFMMLARKWDRLELAMSKAGKLPQYDIFERTIADKREEGLIDDIRDLARYLILVEAELLCLRAERRAKDRATEALSGALSRVPIAKTPKLELNNKQSMGAGYTRPPTGITTPDES